MMRIRREKDRGHADHGWLKTAHTFSFAGYYDPDHTGFRALRVLNDDRVAGGAGFPTHGHRDMEILSWVVEGGLEHRDSMGNGAVVRANELQRMTAGTGVTHSEFNTSDTEPLRFLQIWILPEREGLAPGYEQRRFGPEARAGRLLPIASGNPADRALRIHRDVDLYAARLDPGATVSFELRPGRHAWLQVVTGRVRVGEHELREGDGLAVSREPLPDIEGVESGDVLLFDLA